VEFLIDLAGRSLPVGRRNIALAVGKAGLVHIRSVGRTVIITLEPRLVSQLALAATCYKLADFGPERTILVAGVACPKYSVFLGYIGALATLGWLVGRAAPEAPAPAATHVVEHLVQ
jgi:hypothetical protein